MPDYGHDLVFGTLLEPPPERAHDVVQLAELTERVGLDLVSLSDHPYWPQRLDTLTLLAAIAARTSTVRVLPNLFNLPLRPPAMLARAAATLDILSGGRFELGIGTGAQTMWDAILAEGGPRRGAAESIDALDEAIQLIRALWTPGPDVRFDGPHYRLEGAQPGPAPVHDINIWLGAYQPRLLRLVGRLGDGWVASSPFLPPEQLSAANQIIDEAAISAGRSPQAVRRIYNFGGDFTATGSGFLQGPPKVWVEQLTGLTLTAGISGYILYRVQSAHVIRQFAHEVAPAVRDTVAGERARRNTADCSPRSSDRSQGCRTDSL
jgi:alkanesulfonate monooxygenase SsuD/methylene tetrahydromethanopterin reductase-like flavin-dependent oxidoreductase (luciferase family)